MRAIRFKKSSGAGVVLLLIAAGIATFVYRHPAFLNNWTVVAMAIIACTGMTLIRTEGE